MPRCTPGAEYTSQSPSLSNSECWHFVCMCICLQKCDIPYRLRRYCKLLNLKNNSDTLWAVQLAVQVVQKMSKRKWNRRKWPSACWRRWKARLFQDVRSWKISNVVPKTGTLSQITAEENSVYQQLSVGKMKWPTRDSGVT